jgi:hypothetical protein
LPSTTGGTSAPSWKSRRSSVPEASNDRVDELLVVALVLFCVLVRAREERASHRVELASVLCTG